MNHPRRTESRTHGAGNAAPAGRKNLDKRKSAPRNTRGAPNQAGAASPAAIRIEQLRAVLDQAVKWIHPADAVLSRWMRMNPKLGSRDRSELADAFFKTLRHLRLYRHLAESGQGPLSRRLAIMGLSGVIQPEVLSQALSEQEQVWLEHVTHVDLGTLPLAVRESLPDWLAQRMQALPDGEPLIAALNSNAPLDLRINPFKTDRDTVLRLLEAGPAAALDPQPTPYSPWGIRIHGRPPINRWSLFEKGEIEVQDEGSQLLAALLAPKRGEMVIDYCAGAGGKTLLLGALMRSTGRLYAFDVSATRLARAKPRFARSGLSNIVPVVITDDNDQRVRRLRQKAHRVLVDAPCSGLGTLRRNPDLKWRQSPESVQELCALQARILKQASACVAPGGRLVYATCSVLPEENQAQVDAFLAENPDFSLKNASEVLADRCKNLTFDTPYMVLRPDTHGTDGFFAAVLERAKN
ncbi:MAG TPA: rRNA methyltransferase [Pusillimonas sp.]|jgi:16S rRNA (cytosine967-C5)-methyltransferase|nr:rRNA methyltransferase [Pusillimonas sp.]|tara:strand:+ start:271773 stop:273170 length:1398 start_codon:yes stop_codon:yes gene_type:complete